jgi:catechol 2,3-dioxygenase-like lactoylglutathione lyase family enzyme
MRTKVLAAGFFIFGLLACKADRRSPLLEAARACSHDSELSCARPILNVRDLKASQRYYRDVLGFKVDWEDGEPSDFGSVSRGHGVLFMCQQCQGQPGAWVMLFAQDVDRLHREFVAKQALIRMPPRNMPWGLRELHVTDPDGHVLRFATSSEH